MWVLVRRMTVGPSSFVSAGFTKEGEVMALEKMVGKVISFFESGIP
jgi:hypothetical protein